MLAVVGFEVGLFVATGAAAILTFALGLVNHGSGDDTRRNGDDGVTKNHHDAREEAPDNGNGGDITIANGGEGDNSPIDAGADVGELRIGLSSLYDEHEGSEDGDEDENKEEIDKYLPETEFDALQKKIPLVDEGEEFEDSEDADESEDTQDEKVACGREAGNEGKVERQRRQKVDNAKETEGIILGTRRAVETEDVLNGEEESEDILENSENILETSHHGWFRLDESNDEADGNSDHHDDVECLARWCVGIEHDIIEAGLVFEQCYELFHGCKDSKKFRV